MPRRTQGALDGAAAAVGLLGQQRWLPRQSQGAHSAARLPRRRRQAAALLGQGAPLDELVTAMNRAAESPAGRRCSPIFNWREVPIGGDGVIALLPCKADRAARMLPLGAETVAVDMAGCEAGGATFAVAHAAPAMRRRPKPGWAPGARPRARSLPAAAITETPAALPRSAARPPRCGSTPAAPAPATPTGHMLWFAQQRAGTLALYQATVLGQPSSPEAARHLLRGPASCHERAFSRAAEGWRLSSWPLPSPTSSRRWCAPSPPRCRPRLTDGIRAPLARSRAAGRRLLPRFRAHAVAAGQTGSTATAPSA